MPVERLQKVLARAGVASRRAAEAIITSGRVRVDGRVVTELGTKVDPRGSKVELDGKVLLAESLVYVALHKPRGVVSTMSDPEGRPCVKALLAPAQGRVYPVGRLDFATSGVLLATNDGDFAEALMHPRKKVPKTYVVKVQGEMKPADLDKWRRGVDLEDGKTQPAKCKMLRYEGDKTWFELTITEGRNQQVRRMGEATGFRVMRLARIAFAGVSSEGLRPGDWRYLTVDELQTLKKEWGVPRRIVSPPADVPRRPKRAWTPRPHVEEEDRKPRYGGGAPVRRDLGVRHDWGGGVRRGASGERDEDRAPRGDVGGGGGGRGGRSRTTGTGGGIGASAGSYRVKGRRG
ncbi:MAG TPA: pseudouridine synthase [Polyangiaceae bacterium]|jgi:23S rRNA pseudouridine2605 synthase